MVGKRVGILVAAVCALTGIGAMAPVAHAVPKTSTFYFVGAHADDEAQGWQLIDDYQSHYSVFVTVTQGEGTVACGDPSMYATDLGERAPYGNPWEGMYTEACKRARIASWHWFLDDVAQFDTGFPDFGISASGEPWEDDDYQGRFCPSGHQGEGEGRPIEKRIGCAEVWANQLGARVAFDLGNYEPASFTEADVVAAVQAVRSHRADWGIPVLEEAGVMAVAPGCHRVGASPNENSEHEIVQDALFNHDVGAGPRYGTVCDDDTNRVARRDPTGMTDRRYAAAPGEQQPPDAAEWWQLHAVNPVTLERIGPYQVNYGWLYDTNYTGMAHQPEWTFPLRTLWRRSG